MNISMEKLWTVEEVARFLRVKSSIVKYWLQTSYIPFVKVGKQYRFDPQDVKAWVESLKKKSFTGNISGNLKSIT